MRVRFEEVTTGPERLICDAEIVFDEGILEGCKLVGFKLWRGPDGSVYVTVPSRSFNIEGDRRYFDYLRDASEPPQFTPGAVRRVKLAIVEAWREYNAPTCAGPGCDQAAQNFEGAPLCPSCYAATEHHP